MVLKTKKRRGVIIIVIIFVSMIVFVNTKTNNVESATFDPFTENFTSTTYMDIPNSNVSGWGDGVINNENKKPNLVSEIGFSLIGEPIEVNIQGNLALVGTTSHLKAIDVTNTSNPITIDELAISQVNSIAVANNLAYLSSANGGLFIVNITDPSNLNILDSQLHVSGFCSDVASIGDYVYLAANEIGSFYGVHIMDVSNPLDIQYNLAKIYETNNLTYDIEIKENFAYIGNGSSMVVLNVSDPINPVFHSEYTNLEQVNDLCLYGNQIYIADQSGLVVLDITFPLTPNLVGSYNDIGLSKVAVDGTFAYVTDYNGDLFILDVTDISEIKEISMFDYPGPLSFRYAVSIALAGNNVYVAAYQDGFDILEISNDILPTRVEHFPLTPGVDRAVTIYGDLAIVVGNYWGGIKYHGTLKIYDISDPTNAVLLGEVDHPPGVLDFGHIFYAVEVYENVAYIVGAYMENVLGTWLFKMAFYGFYIGDPTNPTFIGAQIIPTVQEWFAWVEILTFDIEIDGEYMYITCGSEGIAIYDFSNPWSPSFAELYDDGNEFVYAADIHKVGNIAFIADGVNGFKIFDMTDPENPVKIGSRNTPGAAFNVWIEGDLAYLASGTGGLRIIDIEDLKNPDVIGFYDTLNVSNNVHVSGNTAYISDANGGLVVLDVTDPTNPSLLHIYDTDPRCSLEVRVKGDYAFLAEYMGDFEILEVRKNKARQFTDLNQAQSTVIFTGDSTSSLSHATLTSISTTPSGTSITYYLSADNGANWEQITPGVQHYFTNEGRDLRWKAILTTNDFQVSPTISSLTINYVTALASPVLVSPIDGCITDDKTPTFTWSGVDGAKDYKFQLDDSPSFSSPIIDYTDSSSITFHTVISPLAVGTYYWRVAAVDYDDEVGYYSEIRSINIELDISPPDINHPNDFGYLQGTTGHNITWIATDSFKSTYNITEDGSLVIDDTWIDDEIVVDVDGLGAGTHTYVCNVYDQFGLFSSDTVEVTVSITQPPTIDDVANFDYEEGTAGHTITWNPSDNNPDWYNVTRNGALLIGEDGVWDGSSISISVDGLTIGTYTYICTVYDGHGNTAFDTVVVEVMEPIIPTINHPLDLEYESGDTGNTITWDPYDNNPDNYIVELDGEVYDADTWIGGEITINIDDLNVGIHTFVCTVTDIHSNTAEDTVIVTVVDTTDPSIDHPADISYVFEETGNSITWQPRDNNPQSYVLTLDGDVIESDTWNGGDITVNIDGLDVGTHIYLVLVTDSSGNSVSDSVSVTVTEPATTPTTPTPTDEEPFSMIFMLLSFIGVGTVIYYRKKN